MCDLRFCAEKMGVPLHLVQELREAIASGIPAGKIETVDKFVSEQMGSQAINSFLTTSGGFPLLVYEELGSKVGRDCINGRGPLRAALGYLPACASCGRSMFLLLRAQKSGAEQYLEWVSLQSGGSLEDLHQALEEVYLPLLRAAESGENAAGGAKGQVAFTQGRLAAAASELVATLSSFSLFIEETAQLLQGVVYLDMPDSVHDLGNVADEDQTAALEHLIARWCKVISHVLEQQGNLQPRSQAPLAEVKLWRARKHAFLSIHEQLQSEPALKAATTLQERTADLNLINTFTARSDEVRKLAEEAKDNVKFLSTLEWHLRAISAVGADHVTAFNAICEALWPLMESLRLVWVLSPHYSDDARMGSLLQRIGAQIGDHVEGAITLRGAFSMAPDRSQKLLESAGRLLLTWQSSYLQMRDAIEVGGREARWEFPKALLFGRTNHMAMVSADIREMVAAVQQLRQFLGPGLKAVTGDDQAISAVVAQVDEMEQQVAQLDWPIFDREFAEDWAKVKEEFQAAEASCRQASEEVTNACFKRLKSASAACELLDSLLSLVADTSGGLHKQILGKRDKVLHQFSREMHALADTFHAHKASPPIARGLPPVTGAVTWARSLFAKCKTTMRRVLQIHPELVKHPLGFQVDSQYRSFARLLLGYETSLLVSWREYAEDVLGRALQQPLLHEAPGSHRVEIYWLGEADVAVHEAVKLDQMAVAIPSLARTAALVHSQLRQDREALAALVSNYHEAVDGLPAVEKEILTARLAALRACLEPGFSPLIWTSLNITNFVHTAEKAVAEFQSVVTQLHKHSSSINKSVAAIASAKLCPPLLPELHSPVPCMSDLVDKVHQHQSQILSRPKAVEDLVHKYRCIPPLLKKAEELLQGTSTGKSQALAMYYAHWEHQVFGAIHAAVLRGLRQMAVALSARIPEEGLHGALQQPPPLFKVHLQVVAGEVVSNPTAADMKKVLAKLARQIAESAQSLVRWMDGTCIEAPELRGPSEIDEPYIYTFFADISQSAVVVRAVQGISQLVSRAGAAVSHVIGASWKDHSHLWEADKEEVIEKLQAEASSDVIWEEQVEKFQALAASAREMEEAVEVDILLLDPQPLVVSIQTAVQAWVEALTGAREQASKARHMQ